MKKDPDKYKRYESFDALLDWISHASYLDKIKKL